MKDIYVLIDKDTGDFWANTKNFNRKRKIQAYTSEAKALASFKEFWPKPEEGKVIVKKFVAENETE